MYKDVEIKTGKCFAAVGSEDFNNNQWADLGMLEEAGIYNSASSIKAFTVSKTEQTLINIAITTPPTKTQNILKERILIKLEWLLQHTIVMELIM